MGKKLLVAFAVVLFSVFALVNSAFAVQPDPDSFYIHMTDGDGHTGTVGEFGWDALPWLRIHIPETGWSVTGSFWETPEDEYFFSGTSSSDLDRWVSGDDLVNQAQNSVAWLNIRKVGEWYINATYLNAPSGASNFASTSFTVTPEPVSSVLFLVGGASLAAFRYRKKQFSS